MHSTQVLDFLLLTQIIRSCGYNQIYDVEVILDEKRSTLLSQRKTYRALFNDLYGIGRSTEDEREAEDVVEVCSGKDDIQIGQQDFSNEDNTFDEDELEGLERDDRALGAHRRNSSIIPRHASLTDYLRTDNRPLDHLLPNLDQTKMQVVLSTFRVFCRRNDGYMLYWWGEGMADLFNNLESLDDTRLSKGQIKTIVEFIHELYHSETAVHNLMEALTREYTVHRADIFLGPNTDLRRRHRLAIER